LICQNGTAHFEFSIIVEGTTEKVFDFPLPVSLNGTAHIINQCRKTAVLSSHRCLVKTGVEKMNNI